MRYRQYQTKSTHIQLAQLCVQSIFERILFKEIESIVAIKSFFGLYPTFSVDPGIVSPEPIPNSSSLSLLLAFFSPSLSCRPVIYLSFSLPASILSPPVLPAFLLTYFLSLPAVHDAIFNVFAMKTKSNVAY